MDSRGAHGLSYIKSAGRQSRHSLVNEIILKAFSKAGIPVSREPSGLIPGSSLRPDGCSIASWSQGKCIAWDVTCPDTLAASSLSGSALKAGHAAEHAAVNKKQNYSQLAASHTFVPLAFKTLSAMNEEGISGRMIASSEDSRERMFLFQRLSVAVQRGNISCFSGSLRQDSYFVNDIE